MVRCCRPATLRRNFERILVWCVASGALAVGGGLATATPGSAVAAGDRGGRARAASSGSRPRAGPVAHGGLDHRGRSLRRAVPGVHPDRARRVDRDHRRHPVRDGARHRGVRPPRSSWRSPGRWRCGGCTSTGRPRRAPRSSPASDDPGRLGRSAYHLIHPVMVAGIIVAAAGDEKILTFPSSHAHRGVGAADPRRPGAVPGRACRLQVRRVAGRPVDPAGRDRGRSPCWRWPRAHCFRDRASGVRGRGGRRRRGRGPPPPGPKRTAYLTGVTPPPFG